MLYIFKKKVRQERQKNRKMLKIAWRCWWWWWWWAAVLALIAELEYIVLCSKWKKKKKWKMKTWKNKKENKSKNKQSLKNINKLSCDIFLNFSNTWLHCLSLLNLLNLLVFAVIINFYYWHFSSVVKELKFLV